MNALSPQWVDFWDEARAVDILEVAERMGCKLAKAGDDWVGPCPCGAARTDGFVVTPSKYMFWCRPSGAKGGAIEMYCHAYPEATKTEAAEFVLGRDRPSGRREDTPEEKAARERRRAEDEAKRAELAAERERDAAEKLKRDEEAVAAVLARAQPFTGSYAERYMREGRGVTLPRRMTGDLHFVPDVDYFGYPSAGAQHVELLATLPAMVSIIRSVIGEMIGIHITYLDPGQPMKWRPTGCPKRNGSKKFRKVVPFLAGGMIRLGVITETLAIGEGIETTASFWQMKLGPDDASFAVATSLGNLAGGAMQQIDHPTLKDANGKPAKIPNGIPDLDRPGVILPDHVRHVVMLGDGDSDPVSTRIKLLTGAERFGAQGRQVTIFMARDGEDFNSMLKGWRG